MSHTFLLEVGLEDMPAHVVLHAENQLVEKTKAFLNEANLSFENIVGFSSPRRFAVTIYGLASKQKDEELTVRGPAQKIAQDSEGNWTKAAIGFSKGQGGTVEDLVVKEENGEPYVYIEKYIPGKDASEILKGLHTVIKAIEFPKNMKWGTTNYHYIRPIHWMIAMLDEMVIPFEVFDVATGKHTEGHRFLGQQTEISHAEEYEEKLEKEFVIVDRSKRRKMIADQISSLCMEKNWSVPESNEILLDEVTDLVEYPSTYYGTFEKSYLNLPDMVLETSMIDHQRYFPVRSKKDNQLLPFFLFVRNGDSNYIQNVSLGNEKVLAARLADAKFFYEEDQDTALETFVNKLKAVTYHDKLGTLYEKQVRVNNMLPVVEQYFALSDFDMDALSRVASIYKFDLVTQMVNEFPTLQGSIGGIYTEERGEKQEVSQAIREQYLPLSVKGELPTTKLGLLIALLDKMDSLIQFFSVGMIPTGSNDPYALRRQAIGVIRILLDLNSKDLQLDQFVNDLMQVSKLPEERKNKAKDNMVTLVDFLKDRIEQYIQMEQAIPYDIRQAVLGSSNINPNWMVEVGNVLYEYKPKESFKEVSESITRVLNMTKKQGHTGEVNKSLLQTDSEKALSQAVVTLEQDMTEDMSAETFYEKLENISILISSFFENNMVMVKEDEIKENRLTLLNNLAKLVTFFADFSQLVI